MPNITHTYTERTLYLHWEEDNGAPDSGMGSWPPQLPTEHTLLVPLSWWFLRLSMRMH